MLGLTHRYCCMGSAAYSCSCWWTRQLAAASWPGTGKEAQCLWRRRQDFLNTDPEVCLWWWLQWMYAQVCSPALEHLEAVDHCCNDLRVRFGSESFRTHRQVIFALEQQSRSDVIATQRELGIPWLGSTVSCSLYTFFVLFSIGVTAVCWFLSPVSVYFNPYVCLLYFIN